MAMSTTVLIIASCIILKINVFFHCWCMHLSISREPLFTKPDQHNLPGCTSSERHITPVVTVNTPFSPAWQMPRFCICVLGHRSGIFPEQTQACLASVQCSKYFRTTSIPQAKVVERFLYCCVFLQ